MTVHYVLGIDLGQTNDPAALVLLEHELGSEPAYHVRDVYRFPLETSYPDLVERIARRVNQPPLHGRTRVAVDATGVGPPVVDLLRPQLGSARCYAITITGGTTVGGGGTRLTVPKRDLVSTVQVLLQQRRLRIAPELPDTPALIDELLAYRVTISDSGHDSYSAWRERDHDDLVIALSLAAWTAENRPPSRPGGRSFVPRARIPTRIVDGHSPLSAFTNRGFPFTNGWA
jgi:Terminase RNaseH-like domain